MSSFFQTVQAIERQPKVLDVGCSVGLEIVTETGERQR